MSVDFRQAQNVSSAVARNGLVQHRERIWGSQTLFDWSDI